MMTKTVSKPRIQLSKIALIPLFSGFAFFMCTKSVAQEKSIAPPTSTPQTEKSIVNLHVKTYPIQTSENAVHSLAGMTEKPTFPGGIENFYRFIGKNFRAPSQPNVKGKIYATFIIEKDGSISTIEIVRDLGFGTGDEAIRVLKLCPKWTPGKMDGNLVRVLYSLPITISTAN